MSVFRCVILECCHVSGEMRPDTSLIATFCELNINYNLQFYQVWLDLAWLGEQLNKKILFIISYRKNLVIFTLHNSKTSYI